MSHITELLNAHHIPSPSLFNCAILLTYSCMLRSRVHGTVIFECPNCLSYQRHKTKPLKGSVVYCTICQAQYVYGLVMYRIGQGFREGWHRHPVDSVLIEDGLWRSGARANKLLCSSCGDRLFYEAYEHANNPGHIFLESNAP